MTTGQLRCPWMGPCTRRIAAVSPGTKADLPWHPSSQPRCLVQTLPSDNELTGGHP
jgi:hypothetical protein